MTTYTSFRFVSLFFTLSLLTQPIALAQNQPICGNGVRDPNEACDSGVKNGQPGECNSSCSGLIPAKETEDNSAQTVYYAIGSVVLLLSGIYTGYKLHAHCVRPGDNGAPSVWANTKARVAACGASCTCACGCCNRSPVVPLGPALPQPAAGNGQNAGAGVPQVAVVIHPPAATAGAAAYLVQSAGTQADVPPPRTPSVGFGADSGASGGSAGAGGGAGAAGQVKQEHVVRQTKASKARMEAGAAARAAAEAGSSLPPPKTPLRQPTFGGAGGSARGGVRLAPLPQTVKTQSSPPQP
jgi:hypothetical protein